MEEIFRIEHYNRLIMSKLHETEHTIYFDGRMIRADNASMSKLAKTVAAMANNDGGEIIYGIAVKRCRTDSYAPIEDFTQSSDWVYTEIQARIDKPIKGLQVVLVPFPDDNRHQLLHIIIPTNNALPHMSDDGRYYRLRHKKIVVMDETEVRLLYGKTTCCDVEFLGIYNTNGLPVLQNGKFRSISFYPKFAIRNCGGVVERHYKMEIAFPASLYEEQFQPMQSLFLRHEGTNVVFGQRNTHSLFQEEIATIIEGKLFVDSKNIEAFIGGDICVSLFFSNGVKKHRLPLWETFTYNGRKLQPDDFTDSIPPSLEI